MRGQNPSKRTYNYMLMEHAADPDELVREWTESIVGDQYPMPDRILKYTEILVQDYLNQEMCNGQPPQGKFDLYLLLKAEQQGCAMYSTRWKKISCYTKEIV